MKLQFRALWVALVVTWVLLACPTTAMAAPLWGIGTPDEDYAEFALSPNNYRSYQGDALFLAGASEPSTAWPYVLPGPSDAWAGSRTHTATVVFALAAVEAADSLIAVDLVDTQAEFPPTIQLIVNGHATDFVMPAGGGNASIDGTASDGTPYHFELPVPSAWLTVGTNQLEIQSTAGSWLLFDAVGMDAPAGTLLAAQATLIGNATTTRGLVDSGGELFQPIDVTIHHTGPAVDATLSAAGVVSTVSIPPGTSTARILVPAVTVDSDVTVSVDVDGQMKDVVITLKPVKKLTLYVLNHSHVDIGYTDVQSAIETKQVDNLLAGIQLWKDTQDYPVGSRFIWNLEASWVADLYEQRLTQAQRDDFDEAVKSGGVALQGLYLNMLTGLGGPEQLLQLTRFSADLSQRLGVTLDSAIISDVPGYTWGTVTALAQSGIRYFSVAPNNFDRIGDIIVEWEDKPFWWVSQSGNERVLVWVPYRGYSLSHGLGDLNATFLESYQSHLDDVAYPYDLAYIRWSGHGDNAVPERQTADFAKAWNEVYAWPHVVISTTSEAFAALDAAYGATLPEMQGDWTPYWEDGAGSSAAETALGRASSDRLTQAQALFAMQAGNSSYDAAAFNEAWAATLLYAEHTWGSYNSVSEPENPFTLDVWEGKQAYALEADQISRELLQESVAESGPLSVNAVDVFNTTSWKRTDWFLLSAEQSAAGDQITGPGGEVMPSQRLSTGELAVLAVDVPPLAAKRFTIAAGEPGTIDAVALTANSLDNGLVHVELDPVTGAISVLGANGIADNLIDGSAGQGANDYLYFLGADPSVASRNGSVTIVVEESGPLVASLRVESDAPGCNKLVRHVRVVAGMDRVELVDELDKQRAPATPDHIDYAQPTSKESVNLAFPFAVPGGQMYIDVPYAVVRPDQDLIPGACKNWFTVGRWVEVANQDIGVTWATLDAPLIQVGGLTANLLNSQTDPSVWRKVVDPTQTFYVWAMNNHWGTNYRAYQEGLVTFRFALRPHGPNDLAASARFGTGYSQPFIVGPASEVAPSTSSLVTVSEDDVLVTGIKPANDGNGWIIRLFGASGEARSVTLTWASASPLTQWLSDTTEQRITSVPGAIDVPAYGLVTIRADHETVIPDPDAGLPPDGGLPSDGGLPPDAGDASTEKDRPSPSSSDSGCGCKLSGGQGFEGTWFGALALFGLLTRGRVRLRRHRSAVRAAAGRSTYLV